MFQARCISVDMDKNGMIPEDQEDKIRLGTERLGKLICSKIDANWSK